MPKSGRITRDIELRNVMAVLPGKSARRIYISAHYDSFAERLRPRALRREPPRAPSNSSRPPSTAAGAPPAGQAAARTPSAAPAAPVDNPAPGVNDDGSGTALVMELARVFGESGIEFDATLVFIALAGEEQGLIGAQMHAAEGRRRRSTSSTPC